MFLVGMTSSLSVTGISCVDQLVVSINDEGSLVMIAGFPGPHTWTIFFEPFETNRVKVIDERPKQQIQIRRIPVKVWAISAKIIY